MDLGADDAVAVATDEVVLVHSQTTIDSTSDDDDSVLELSSCSSAESHPAPGNDTYQQHSMKENCSSGVFKLTKAPSNMMAIMMPQHQQTGAATCKRSATSNPPTAAVRKKKRKDIASNKTIATATTTATNSAHDDKSTNHDAAPAAATTSRRVRRTPLEGAEAEERRVQNELILARQRMAAQKTKPVAAAPLTNDSVADMPVLAEMTRQLATGSQATKPRPGDMTDAKELTKEPTKSGPQSAIASATTVAKSAAVATDSLPASKAQVVTVSHDAVSKKTVALATKSVNANNMASARVADMKEAADGKPAATGKPSGTTASNEKPRKKKQTFDEQVLSHMLLAFKPFTLKTLAQELKSTETIVNFSMLSMIDKGLVVKKEFTSASGNISKTLYWANHGVTTKELSTTTPATGEQMLVTKQQLDQLRFQQSAVHRELAAVLETASNEDLANQVSCEESSLAESKKQLDEMEHRIRDKRQPQTAAQRPNMFGRTGTLKSAAHMAAGNQCPRRLKIRINNMRAEWKNRKDKCMAFVDTLADCLDKRPKDIYKLIDLETDEMVGANMPAKQVVDARR